jgi:hypothetical protein
MKEEKEEKGFVFKDRRKLSAEAAEEEPESIVEPEPEAGASRSGSGEGAEEECAPWSGALLPEVTFSTFVFSLSSSALVHLGEIPEPMSQKMHQDLVLAKQIIDTLGMLADKTRGNLDAGEDRLLKNVLCDLRLRYVQKSQ